MSAFVPLPYGFYCCGTAVYFEILYCDTYSVVLFAQYALLQCMQKHFRIYFQYIWWISFAFDGDCIEHVDYF
jgi:hypothetical protein